MSQTYCRKLKVAPALPFQVSLTWRVTTTVSRLENSGCFSVRALTTWPTTMVSDFSTSSARFRGTTMPPRWARAAEQESSVSNPTQIRTGGRGGRTTVAATIPRAVSPLQVKLAALREEKRHRAEFPIDQTARLR